MDGFNQSGWPELPGPDDLDNETVEDYLDLFYNSFAGILMCHFSGVTYALVNQGKINIPVAGTCRRGYLHYRHNKDLVGARAGAKTCIVPPTKQYRSIKQRLMELMQQHHTKPQPEKTKNANTMGKPFALVPTQ